MSTTTGVARFLAGLEVMLDLDVRSREQALEAVARQMAAAGHVDADVVYRALWRREQAGSTAVGHVALPHARLAGIDEPLLVFVRTKRPIPFAAADHQWVSILFAILVPEAANEQHLLILAAAAERLSDERVLAQLQTATSASAVRDLFR